MNKNYLAIDFWTKKSWLAYNIDDFCFPLKTISSKILIEELQELYSKKEYHSFILGMPFNIDWSLSPHAKKVKYFAKKLEKLFPKTPIIFFDERLTSAQAKMDVIEYNSPIDIDSESARIILENFLLSKK